MAIEAVWDKLKKQKAKSDALPKRDPGGFVSQSLRKPGESFMDFTKRRHEVLYPGAQQMARQAGVGGFRAFGPAHQAYQNQLRARMGKAPGARYNSQDWQRMMAGLNPSTYPAGAAQVGGAPRPGPRPGVPLPQGAYQGDPRGRTPAAVGAANYNVLGAAPRPPTQVQVPMGSGYASPFRGMSQEQIDTINQNNAARMQRQAEHIMNRRRGEPEMFGRGYGSRWRHGSFPVLGPQMTGMEWDRGGGGLGPRTPETTRPSWQQYDALRRGLRTEAQSPGYNVLGGPREFQGGPTVIDERSGLRTAFPLMHGRLGRMMDRRRQLPMIPGLLPRPF